MKRDHLHLHPQDPSSGGAAATTSSTTAAACGSMATAGKSKIWEEENQLHDSGVDELLAVLGYKVKSSNMAEVAQKLEQLEEVMYQTQDDGLTHLSTDTVHYNPSDLSTWLESMLSELNPLSTQSIDFSDSSDYDLKAIPGKAVYTQAEPVTAVRENKRVKTSVTSDTLSFSPASVFPNETTRPVVLVDSQETGVRLVHTLMACAEAIQSDDLKLADALVKHIGVLAVHQPGAMKKVATYFAEALARRIYRLYPQPNPNDTPFTDLLQMHFYESCPYLKFGHFTANQAILEAFAGKKRVHVIDFSMKQGMQWPALMQALRLRPEGPPSFRLTGIGPPQPNNTDPLQEVGWKLAQLAESINVEFEYRGFIANSLADLDASMLNLRPSEVEAVAVNSVFELHRLLARPGSLEKVLKVVKEIKPQIMTVVEQEANHNGPVFLDRFNESLHYYSTLFDSLEGCGLTPPDSEDKVMSEVYLGRQICNVVACEGPDRVERHETLAQWRTRFNSAGLAPVHLGSNAFKQASMLLALFAGGDGYRVEENDGCLMLGWHTRPLIAASAWQLATPA